MSGALSFSVVLDVEPACEDEFLALITPVLRAMRSETTFISATFARDAIVPHRFLLFEQWADRALFLDVEMKRPYRAAYLGRLAHLLARPRQVTEWIELRSDHALQIRSSG